MSDSFMVSSLHDPAQCDRDGKATFEYPGMLPGRVTFGYATPTRRKQRRMASRADQLRRQRRSKVEHSRAKYIIQRIEREAFEREVQEALDQLVAEGSVRLNSDGTYQWNPTLEEKMAARRQRLRGAER